MQNRDLKPTLHLLPQMRGPAEEILSILYYLSFIHAACAASCENTVVADQISSFGHSNCAILKENRAIECWGNFFSSGDSPYIAPEGRFLRVAVGTSHACGVSEAGMVACFGENDRGQASPPAEQRFVYLAAGLDFTCGIENDGKVACWGAGESNDDCSYPNYNCGQSLPPTGTFIHLSAAKRYSCGITDMGNVECWGWVVREPPLEKFKKISLGDLYGCGVLEDGLVECWGDFDASAFGDDRYVDIASGECHTCAISKTNEIVCAGCNSWSQLLAPDEKFDFVSAGWDHSCGIRTDGHIECWGDNSWDESSPP